MSNDRDTYTDASRSGEGQLQKRDVGHEMSFAPLTVDQERAMHGYNLGDKPGGSRTSRSLDTAGNRGAADIRR